MSKHPRKEPPQAWSGSPLRLGKTSASPQNPIGSKVSQAPGSYKRKGFHRGLSPFVRLFLRGLSPFARIAHKLFRVMVSTGQSFRRGLSPFARGLSPFALFATAVTMQWTRDAEGGGAVAAFGP